MAWDKRNTLRERKRQGGEMRDDVEEEKERRKNEGRVDSVQPTPTYLVYGIECRSLLRSAA